MSTRKIVVKRDEINNGNSISISYKVFKIDSGYDFSPEMIMRQSISSLSYECQIQQADGKYALLSVLDSQVIAILEENDGRGRQTAEDMARGRALNQARDLSTRLKDRGFEVLDLTQYRGTSKPT